jgi:hypothetical protein
MRRIFTVFALASVAMLALHPAAASTSTFTAHFRETFHRGKAPSGNGAILGYGKATETFSSYDELHEGTCNTFFGNTVIALASDPSSTLTTDESDFSCTPGASRDAPNDPQSYGNPERGTGAFQIIDGTGIFEDATGSGEVTLSIAGDIIVIDYEGTITIP